MRVPDNAGELEAMLEEREARMQRIQEILDQLEFERKRHIKTSNLIAVDFDISMGHVEAASKIKQAIRIIECALEYGEIETDDPDLAGWEGDRR